MGTLLGMVSRRWRMAAGPASRTASWIGTLPQSSRLAVGRLEPTGSDQDREKAATGSGRRRPCSEAESGSERNPQVVVGAVLEVDLVTSVESQAKRARKALDPQSGIDCRRSVARGDIAQRVLE